MLFGKKRVPAHDEKVERISKQLKRRKSRAPVSLRKKAVSHEVPKPDDKRFQDDKIDISDLDRILEIDPRNRTCIAEPGVTFSELVDATMRYDLVPVIVPEFKTITIGGAVAGGSLESMSFRYGGFHDTCIKYEVVTANGDVRECGKGDLLFQMLHGTFGTLGILTKLEFDLIPSKPYVRVEFDRYDSIKDFKDGVLKHYIERDIDFMDGFIHGVDDLVINKGYFVDKAPYTSDYERTKVFYKRSRKVEEDYLRTPDYYFRYNSGVTNTIPLPLKLIFGSRLSSNEVLRFTERFHSRIPSSVIPVTVDLFLPFSRLEDFIGWYSKELDHFPLWCVPYRRVRDYEWVSADYYRRYGDELILDLAIYGMKKKDDRNYYRLLEEKLMEIGGIKTLISSNYYTEDEFWSIWNRDNYYRVKKEVDPDNIFRDLYQKMCRASMGADD